MIAVDSSALIAIFELEDDASRFVDRIEQASGLIMSAVNVHETGVVLMSRRGPLAVDRMWRFLDENAFEIIAFDIALAKAAIAAFERYGKGRHSQARLNLADCAAYALAMTYNVPLLFKGADFVSTDVLVCT